MRVRGFVAVSLTLAFGIGALAGCSYSSSGGDRGGCAPRMTAAPRTVHPGDRVTVSSSDVCDVPVPDGGWVVTARQPLEDGRQVSERTDEALDGTWSVTVTLPPDFPPGEVSFGIENWDYSTCADGGSCAGPLGGFTVEAMPTATPTPSP